MTVFPCPNRLFGLDQTSRDGRGGSGIALAPAADKAPTTIPTQAALRRPPRRSRKVIGPQDPVCVFTRLHHGTADLAVFFPETVFALSRGELVGTRRHGERSIGHPHNVGKTDLLCGAR